MNECVCLHVYQGCPMPVPAPGYYSKLLIFLGSVILAYTDRLLPIGPSDGEEINSSASRDPRLPNLPPQI